jgi:hypothetical protein
MDRAGAWAKAMEAMEIARKTRRAHTANFDRLPADFPGK